MDFSKFKTSDWLLVGGGVAMLILGFALPWSTVSFAGISDSGDGPFDYFLTGGIAWLLVVAAGVLAFLRATDKLGGSQPWPLIFLGMTGLATLLMIIQLILGGREDFIDRGIGMYLAFVWAAVALAGAFMAFQASGGEISDLTNMDKLKSSFDGDGDSGAGTPPPPPPPPAQ